MSVVGSNARDRQLTATRTAIIEAFLDLAHSENAVSISVPAVAVRAGVSVRTVYRHFPTKSDLQTAAAFYYSHRAQTALQRSNSDGVDGPAYLRTLWADFATQIPAVIAEQASPAGRELRATRLDANRAVVRRAAPAVADDPEQVDLLVAITSSSMFLELVDRMGYSPERAADLVLHLSQLVINDATTKETAR